MVNIFLLGLMWGSAFAIARFIIRSGVDPIIYSFLTVFISAMIMLGYCWRKRKIQELFSNNKSHYFIAGLFGIVLPNTNKYWLAAHLPSGLLAIIVGTTPFFIYPLALFCKEEKFKFRRSLGLLIGGIGIMLLAVIHSKVGVFAVDSWSIFGLLTPLSYAICAVYVAKSISKSTDIVLLTTGMLIASALLLMPFVFFVIKGVSLAKIFTFKIDMVILSEVALGIVGYILLFKILTSYGSVNYSLVNGVGAIVGLLWGWCFFHETNPTNIFWAIICIFIGAWLLNHKKST